MKIVGLNLSDSSLEAVEMNRGMFGGESITAIARHGIADGIVENGIIHDRKALVEVVRTALQSAEPTSITTKQLSLSIPESQVYSRVLRLSVDGAHDAVMNQLGQELPKYIPFRNDEIVYDYIPLHDRGDDSDVLAVAVPKSVLVEYKALADDLGMTIKSIELESISSARAIINSKDLQQPVLILDLGSRTTIVSFFDSNGLRFTYNMSVAGDSITEHIIKNTKMNFREAEQEKHAKGIGDNADAAIKDLIEDVLGKMVSSLQEAIHYYEQRYQHKVEKVLLLGGTAQMHGLPKYMAKQLSLECVRADILPNLTKTGILDELNQGAILYANALGLALGVTRKLSRSEYINFKKS